MFRRLMLPVAAALCGLATLGASTPVQDAETISRFLQSHRPALTSYRARRHMEASTRGGTMRASLDAWTSLALDGSFSFEIIQESGSDLIRGHVLRAALIEEQRSRHANELDAVSLTPANYALRVGPPTGDLIRIELMPKRRTRMLIVGSALVTRNDADLVRVEGTLAKRPSLWTRRVEVTRRYARVAGVRVPIEMRSTADVMLVGASTFSMTYHYVMINERPVDDGTAFVGLRE
jgi:hypothetical protein